MNKMKLIELIARHTREGELADLFLQKLDAV
jgi:hypothetical protein